MSAALRWLTAVAGSIAAFLLVAVPWALLSSGGDDPWDVIGPVAGVVAAGVLAALGWWASQTGGTAGGGVRRVRQSARGGGDITQTAGDHGTGVGGRRRLAREDVRQKARGKGTGNINQTGGKRS
ncbi:hypothetical protein ACIRJS_37310 [Streptomyces sp. NPDC102340]|uniref:hypothetical protein n=1 Tax=unclassified Streptomyces TaxID=2593676 RepID=UPI00381835AC